MNQYSRYQEIGLPWLQKIPAHWEIRRNKNVFIEQKEEVGENSSAYTLLSLTLRGIIPRDMDGGGKFPSSFDKYKVIKKDIWLFAYLTLTRRHARWDCPSMMECSLGHTPLCV